MLPKEERREIAARLREHQHDDVRASTYEDGMVSSWLRLKDALGADGDDPQEDHTMMFGYLADLIEPEERTCRVKDMRCTRCGGNLDSYFHFSDEGSEWKIRPFCSWCGAKILNHYTKFQRVEHEESYLES